MNYASYANFSSNLESSTKSIEQSIITLGSLTTRDQGGTPWDKRIHVLMGGNIC